MKYAIVGSGACGCLIGTGLKRGGAKVHLVDPYEAHIKAIAENGLEMTIRTTTTGELEHCNMTFDSATVTGNGVGICDGIIILVKGMNTRKMMEEHGDLIGPDTIVMTLQNGIGNIDIIADFIKRDHIVGGVLKSGGNLQSPGVVFGIVTGGQFTDIYYAFTEPSSRAAEVMSDMEAALNAGGITTTFDADLETMIWDKLYINAMCNIPCAVMHTNLETAFRNEHFAPILYEIGAEVCRVATAKGFPMNEKTCWETFAVPMEKLSSHSYSSATLDSMRKFKTEIEFLTGAVVREGEKVGVPTPMNKLFLSLGRAMEDFYPFSTWTGC